MSTARAIAIRWRSPPDSVAPRSPITVSYPSGSAAMNSCALAVRAARLDLRPRRVGPAERDVFRDARRKEKRLLEHDGNLIAQAPDLQVAHVVSIDEHAASLRIEESRNETHERALARAGFAHDRHHFAGAGGDRDAAQDRLLLAVPERDVVEDDLATHRRQRQRARPLAERRPPCRTPRITRSMLAPAVCSVEYIVVNTDNCHCSDAR